MTVGFLSSGSIGTVVHNLRLIRSSAGLYPISVGVVLYAKIAKYISSSFFIKFFIVWTARSASPLDCRKYGPLVM